jgi:hypothetical protein
MPTYDEYVRLARMCLRQANFSLTEHRVATELRRMAREYQQEAAKLNGGKLPDLTDQAGEQTGGSATELSREFDDSGFVRWRTLLRFRHG